MSDLPDPFGGMPAAGPASAPPPQWLAELPDDTNPYASRLRQNPALGEISLPERARLNAREAEYRGTLAGSQELLELRRIAGMTPEIWADYSKAQEAAAQTALAARGPFAAPGEFGPPAIPTPDEARKRLDEVRADLARYE